MMRLCFEWPHWAFDVSLAKYVHQTGCCPTCKNSIHLLDDEIGLAKATAEEKIAEVRLLVEWDTRHSPRDAIDTTPLLGATR